MDNKPEETIKQEIKAEETIEPKVKRGFSESMRARGFTKKYMIGTGIFFALSLLAYVFSRLFPAFAEFWARYPSQGMRAVLSFISGLFGFSLAELLVLISPILIVSYLVASSRSTKKDESDENYHRWLNPLLCAIVLVVSYFFSAFGPCYFRNSLDKNLSITRNAVSAQELYDTALIINEKLQADIDEVEFAYKGFSENPYDYAELMKQMNESFASYAATVPYISHFPSRVKPIALSEPFTYTHISGVYTFITGEANYNTNFPDYVLPYTIAHEMSHQRGIAREDEANFTAYLVCIQSESAYVRYSGYANMLDYLLDALYVADKTMYTEFLTEHISNELYYEYAAYSDFFDKYRGSVASEVVKAVSNTYLGSQGQTEGVKSYGLVVDLAVAYYK